MCCSFCYDWRQFNDSPRVARLLAERVETVLRVAGAARLDLVSHSNGGLLVNSVLALQPALQQRIANCT